jgi:polyhydroxybutyrate depolymerase
MKKIAILLLFTTLSFCLNAQYTTRNFTFDNMNRQYLLYVPPIYDGTEAVPFVIALHGLGDNMNNFKGINFKSIADTANFIFAIPQALVDSVFSGSTAWNSGAGAFGITLNANVDDVGFLNALIDTVSAAYNIDQQRIYATGFSMGGFMSNRLACELNNRIAAIASVSGTIGNGLTCQPSRAIPVAHFHGTADGTVGYTNNTFGNDAEALVKFWAEHDNCDTLNVITDSLPDTANDGKKIIHYTYADGSYNTEVEFFKVIGGQHEWLSAANDISYSYEIWKFFSKHKWESQTGIAINKANSLMVNVFPNPSSNRINISFDNPADRIVELKLFDVNGIMIYSDYLVPTDSVFSISTSNYNNGVYMLQIENENHLSFNKIILLK